MFDTPILLITFNRPEHTYRVLEAIMAAQPKDLYVFQDGAREGNEKDLVNCPKVREVVQKLVEGTETNLHSYYSERNLGCGPGPASAITWFFDNVEQGIVVEDDCLVSSSIFNFYEELLNKYKDDDRISMITGTNPFVKWKTKKGTCFFAKNGASPMGCWASWRKSWKLFDYQIALWKEENCKKKIKSYFDRKDYYEFYSDLYNDLCGSDQKHMWDYQWAFARYLNGTLSVVSSSNQVSNIGFCEGATHSADVHNKYANLQTYKVDGIIGPRTVSADRTYDFYYFYRNNYKEKKSFLLRAILLIMKFAFCR